MTVSLTSHHTKLATSKDEWLTPPSLVEALGPFDLDPCAPIVRPWDTATQHLTIDDDGLTSDWFGLVWCNPPYGGETKHWLKKLSTHPAGGIALVFARTETKAFQEHVWSSAGNVMFLSGRLRFHHVTGEVAAFNAGAPSCLVGYGAGADRLAERAPQLEGVLVTEWRGI